MSGMDVISLSGRSLEKKNVKLKSESNTKAIYPTKIDTPILSSLKSAVNIKPRLTEIAN